MKNNSFPKRFRLIHSAEFRKVYDEGIKQRSKAFMIFYLFGEENKPARLGITVTKSFGTAVRRNRIKRYIRESFRHIHPHLKSGADIVINVHRLADDFTQKQVFDTLSSLFLKAGLTRAETD